jgi:hypothetical protein
MADIKREAAMLRAKELYAERLQAEADLAGAEAQENIELAAMYIDKIGSIDVAGAALDNLYNKEMAKRNPARPLPDTEGEFMAKAPERMTYDDAYRVTSKSRYALPPEQEAKNFRQGIEELRRRKASGDVQT